MKKNIYTAWIFAVIFLSATYGFATNGNINDETTVPWNRVSYKVVIQIPSNISLCDEYMVELIDADGNTVAPQQLFIPEKTEYQFDEATRQTKGVRIARLVIVQSGQKYICPTKLYTQPVGRVITFGNGNSYEFDLYPGIWSKLYSTE
jgi:hypothetical protein